MTAIDPAKLSEAIDRATADLKFFDGLDPELKVLAETLIAAGRETLARMRQGEEGR